VLSVLAVSVRPFAGEFPMLGLNGNRIAVLIALIVMMLIAAGSGYRLQISGNSFTFERNARP
jgi:hypothetical protein